MTSVSTRLSIRRDDSQSGRSLLLPSLTENWAQPLLVLSLRCLINPFPFLSYCSLSFFIVGFTVSFLSRAGSRVLIRPAVQSGDKSGCLKLGSVAVVLLFFVLRQGFKYLRQTLNSLCRQ